MANSINAFEMAQRQFDHVAELLKLDPQVAEILRWPLREFHFRILCAWMMERCVFLRLPRSTQ
jgi:hypothetical protein